MKFTRWILFLITAAATAGTLTPSWTNPVTYTDGSALAATDITQTRVEYGSCNGTAFGTKAGEVKATGAATTGPAITVGPGTYCLRAYTTAKGVESAASAVAVATIAQPAPNPPVLKTVDVTAYKMRQSIDGFSFVTIGTVPLGIECNAALNADGVYVVPRSSVKLASKFDTLPLVTFAKCG